MQTPATLYLLNRRFYPPTWVHSQPSRVAPMRGGAAFKRPAAELGALVVGDGLANFGLGIHDKRAVLGDWLGYGLAL